MVKTFRKGQTMVEYIIIVGLIAISLIAVVTYMSRAIGKRAAGATSALDSEEGSKAQNAILDEPEDQIRKLDDVRAR